MERTRTIAGAPVRSSTEAWDVVCKLIADTLERSSAVPVGTVTNELKCLKGIGAALIGGGHLEKQGLLLVDEQLDLTIKVVTADAALNLDENLNPVPGGAAATSSWSLLIPTDSPLKGAIEAAVKNSTHLSVKKTQNAVRKVTIVNEADPIVDLDALRRLGGLK